MISNIDVGLVSVFIEIIGLLFCRKSLVLALFLTIVFTIIIFFIA